MTNNIEAIHIFCFCSIVTNPYDTKKQLNKVEANKTLQGFVHPISNQSQMTLENLIFGTHIISCQNKNDQI